MYAKRNHRHPLSVVANRSVRAAKSDIKNRPKGGIATVGAYITTANHRTIGIEIRMASAYNEVPAIWVDCGWPECGVVHILPQFLG